MTFIGKPWPHSRIASGIRATDGIGRMNSITGEIILYARSDVPMRIPIGTLMSVASARPTAQAASVASTCLRNAGSDQELDHALTTVEARGR